MRNSLLATHPLATMIAIVWGLVGLVLAVSSGLFRMWANDLTIVGTWLAVGSGFLWYLAAIVPLIWSDRPLIRAWCNLGAAVCAAGSASYLVPDNKLTVVRSAFGLG